MDSNQIALAFIGLYLLFAGVAATASALDLAVEVVRQGLAEGASIADRLRLLPLTALFFAYVWGCLHRVATRFRKVLVSSAEETARIATLACESAISVVKGFINVLKATHLPGILQWVFVHLVGSAEDFVNYVCDDRPKLSERRRVVHTRQSKYDAQLLRLSQLNDQVAWMFQRASETFDSARGSRFSREYKLLRPTQFSGWVAAVVPKQGPIPVLDPWYRLCHRLDIRLHWCNQTVLRLDAVIERNQVSFAGLERQLYHFSRQHEAIIDQARALKLRATERFVSGIRAQSLTDPSPASAELSCLPRLGPVFPPAMRRPRIDERVRLATIACKEAQAAFKMALAKENRFWLTRATVSVARAAAQRRLISAHAKELRLMEQLCWGEMVEKVMEEQGAAAVVATPAEHALPKPTLSLTAEETGALDASINATEPTDLKLLGIEEMVKKVVRSAVPEEPETSLTREKEDDRVAEAQMSLARTVEVIPVSAVYEPNPVVEQGEVTTMATNQPMEEPEKIGVTPSEARVSVMPAYEPKPTSSEVMVAMETVEFYHGVSKTKPSLMELDDKDSVMRTNEPEHAFSPENHVMDTVVTPVLAYLEYAFSYEDHPMETVEAASLVISEVEQDEEMDVPMEITDEAEMDGVAPTYSFGPADSEMEKPEVTDGFEAEGNQQMNDAVNEPTMAAYKADMGITPDADGQISSAAAEGVMTDAPAPESPADGLAGQAPMEDILRDGNDWWAKNHPKEAARAAYREAEARRAQFAMSSPSAPVLPTPQQNTIFPAEALDIAPWHPDAETAAKAAQIAFKMSKAATTGQSEALDTSARAEAASTAEAASRPGSKRNLGRVEVDYENDTDEMAMDTDSARVVRDYSGADNRADKQEIDEKAVALFEAMSPAVESNSRPPADAVLPREAVIPMYRQNTFSDTGGWNGRISNSLFPRTGSLSVAVPPRPP
ncbi:hypothetical protein N0V88_004601 [Collariella sp. IMI 366227]|nr:hypothetical protein N0V88_004601 [Collariella sp. IMI 366227]